MNKLYVEHCKCNKSSWLDIDWIHFDNLFNEKKKKLNTDWWCINIMWCWTKIQIKIKEKPSFARTLKVKFFKIISHNELLISRRRNKMPDIQRTVYTRCTAHTHWLIFVRCPLPFIVSNIERRIKKGTKVNME